MSEAKKQDSFIWFGGESFDQILAAMQAVANDPDRRIEFHLEKDDSAVVFVEPQVEAAEGGGGGGTNDSHVCPPQCP